MSKDSKLPKARSMTRRELKVFRESGMDPVFTEDRPMTSLDILKMQALSQEWILENIYAGCDFEDTPNELLSKLASDTWEKTYGIGTKEKEAEKN